MSPYLILHRPSEKYGSCTQFPSSPLQIFSEVVKLKSLEGKEKEDSIPPRNVWLGRAPLCQALASDNCWCCSTHFRASRRGSQIIINQPCILLSPHCCWIPLKEWQTFLIWIFLVEGKGSANKRYRNRDAFSKAALGKGRKAALMKNM